MADGTLAGPSGVSTAAESRPSTPHSVDPPLTGATSSGSVIPPSDEATRTKTCGLRKLPDSCSFPFSFLLLLVGFSESVLWGIVLLSCLSMQRELSSLEYSISHGIRLRPILMPGKLGYSLQRGRGGFLDCMWGVQTHSGPLVFLVPFCKDLARMNGTPQPNQR